VAVRYWVLVAPVLLQHAATGLGHHHHHHAMDGEK